MKVIAQTAALGEALSLASNIVAIRTPKPVLQCVKLVAKDKMLTLLVTDLEAACRYVISQVEVEEEGEALVPAQKFTDIVHSAGEETLTLSVEKDICSITGPGSRFKLLGYDPAEYPPVEEFPDEGEDFQVPSEILLGLIRKTLFAAARAHSHYAISGVLWEASGKKLQLVATDGHRLALARASLPKAAGRDVSAIVPAKLMSLLRTAAGAGEEMLSVKVTENQILVRTARVVLLSSLVQGNFPKYADVIPKEATCKAVVETGALMHRLVQAALLTSEESRSVRLSFVQDQLTLTSRSPETGEAEVTLPVQFDGDPLEMAFNPTFLIDALKVVEADEVTMEFSTPNRPALMKAGSDFNYVVMPVDVS